MEGPAVKVTSTEFQQNVGRYQDAALQAPVIITKHNRPHTVLLSAALFEVFAKGRVARRVEDLDDETIKAIANAASPPTPDLDHLLEDWTP
jgi:prevent-host-death family protein